MILLTLLFAVEAHAQQGLVFSGDTRDVYLSAYASRTGGCPKTKCGALAPCWGFTEENSNFTFVKLYSSYQGPPPCTLCSCCMEAAAINTGVVNVILYVDPSTGQPLSKHQGGQPVWGEYIPAGSRLYKDPGGILASVEACINYGCDATCIHLATLAIGDQTLFDRQWPICASGFNNTRHANLTDGRAAFLAFIFAMANNCTWTITTVDLNDTKVWVPVDTLKPRPLDELSIKEISITQSSRQDWPKLQLGKTDFSGAQADSLLRHRKISLTNLSTRDWPDLQLRVYDFAGAPVDSLFIPKLAAFQRLNWVTSKISGSSSLRFIAGDSTFSILPMRDPARMAYFGAKPIAPHILLKATDSTGTTVNLVKHSGNQYARSRPGRLTVDLHPNEPAGWSIESIDVVKPQNDEFNDSTLAAFWTVENPSAPSSSISTTGRPGYLRIVATQAGGGADYWTGSNFRAPRIFQNVTGDWTLETKMEYSPSDNYEGAGIFIDGQRVAERGFNGGHVVACLGPSVPYDGTTTYFRIIKRADSLAGYWSADGQTWNFNGKVKMEPESVGLHVVRKNWEAGGDHDAVADFDYFRFSGITSVADRETHDLPANFSLSQNYPNPFNPVTQIRFGLPKAAHVRLEIYNVSGQRVATLVDEQKLAGQYSVEFDASKLASGSYFYRIEVGEFSAVKKLLMIK
jgi:hypothetical protein